MIVPADTLTVADSLAVTDSIAAVDSVVEIKPLALPENPKVRPDTLVRKPMLQQRPDASRFKKRMKDEL